MHLFRNLHMRRLLACCVIAGLGVCLLPGTMPGLRLIGFALIIGCGSAAAVALVGLVRSRRDPYDLSTLWDTPAMETPIREADEAELVYCHHCGDAFPSAFDLCPHCGNRFRG